MLKRSLVVSLMVLIGAGCSGGSAGNCTVTKNSSTGVATITCPDGTSVDVAPGQNGTNGANGATGANGMNGTNGTNGANGTAGADGTSCTVTRDADAGVTTISCADGTMATVLDGQQGAQGDAGRDGQNGTACTVSRDLDAGTTTIACADGTNATVLDGQVGSRGPQGNAGTSCTVTRDADAGTSTISCADGTTAVVPDGAQGPAGSAGDGGTLAPSLTFVSPNRVAVGVNAVVQVVGQGTQFTSGSTVGFGAGVTVNSVTAVSATNLECSITVSPTAALGIRTVTVTTGSQVLSLSSGLRVVESLSATVMSGHLQQGASAVLRLKLTGGSFVPAVSGTSLVVANVSSFAFTGGLTVTGSRWLAADTADVTVSVSPFATVGTTDATVTFNDGSKTELATAFASIDLNPAASLTDGTPSSGAVLALREANLFTIALNAGEMLNVNLTPGSTLAPRVRVYAAGNATPLSDTTGNAAFARIAAAGTYTVSVVDANNGGAVTGFDYSITPTRLGLETEPNGTVATATALTLGGRAVGGSITAADKDFYAFTVTTAGTYQFDTAQAGTAVDTQIYVCLATASTCVFSSTDAAASNAGQDQDSGPGLYSALQVKLAPGNYVVVVEAFSGTAIGDYVLNARGISTTLEVEPNDSAATAQSMQLSQVIEASSSAIADKDWYSFTVTAAGNYTIQTRPQANSASPSVDNLDTQMWLCTTTQAASTCTYTAGNTTFNDDTGVRNYSLINVTLSPGTWYVGVQVYASFTGTVPANYFLTIAPQ